MKNRTVYLAGKVTGLPRWYVVLKFTIYDLFLTWMGYQVYNPVREIAKEKTWDESLIICLENLNGCDYVYFQFDWLSSEGAKIEFNEAAKQNKVLLNSGYKIRKFYKFLINLQEEVQ